MFCRKSIKIVYVMCSLCFKNHSVRQNQVLLTFGPKTRRTVTVVLSCVLINPSRYLISGPALGNRNKLQ